MLAQLDSFRDLINNTHLTVDVAGCYFEPADVLERMDPQAFNILLQEFMYELSMDEMKDEYTRGAL
jgi:hypothetical protein